MSTYTYAEVLTYEQVLDDLRAIVAERGADYVYPKVTVAREGQCVYFDPANGAPSCIVGHWFARRDVDLWDEDYGYDWDVNLEMNVREVFDDCGLPLPFAIDDRAVTLLMQVQKQQDVGVPWGEALDFAARWTAEVTS